MYHSFLIHSSADGHLGCFYVLAIINSAAMNIKPVNLKGDQPWIFTGRIDAEAQVFWSSDANSWLIGCWCWERLRAEGEEDIRGWDGWMASLMQWTWTWANFGRWWGIWRPGMLQSMGHRVEHDWATEQKRTTCLQYSWVCLLFNVI